MHDFFLFFFLSAWFQQNENRCDLKYRKQWEDSEYRWNMGRNFWQEEWFWATKNSFYNLEKGLGLSSQQFYRMKDRDCWGKLSFMCLTYVSDICDQPWSQRSNINWKKKNSGVWEFWILGKSALVETCIKKCNTFKEDHLESAQLARYFIFCRVFYFVFRTVLSLISPLGARQSYHL